MKQRLGSTTTEPCLLEPKRTFHIQVKNVTFFTKVALGKSGSDQPSLVKLMVMMMQVSKGKPSLLGKASLHMAPGFLLFRNTAWQSIFREEIVFTAHCTEHSDILGMKMNIEMNHSFLSVGDCH